MQTPNSVLSSYGVTIFEVMSRLAIESDAINLGQGFPDRDGPRDILEAAAEALLTGPNQYPPMLGLPALRQAQAEHDRRLFGIDVDWQSQVLVTSGATEALADCLMALVEPGDEVVLIEPLYDCYLPMVRRAGAIPRLVRLEPPDWTLPEARLREAFGPKTKALLINNPMNPAAKVFDEQELRFLAGLVAEHDAFVISDEVYQHIVFDGRRHIPFSTLPDMADRTVRIGSAGKSFSLTGWKVGYITAPAALLQPIAKAHQFVTFTTPPNLQNAVAFALNKEESYFAGLAAEMQAKRDRLSAGMESIGLKPVPAAGTYFLTVDISGVARGGEVDSEFCRRITTEAKVAAVPVGAFYAEDGPKNFIRFCFSKMDDVLDEAVDRLGGYLNRTS